MWRRTRSTRRIRTRMTTTTGEPDATGCPECGEILGSPDKADDEGWDEGDSWAEDEGEGDSPNK